MLRKKKILITSGGFLTDTYRESGVLGCVRKISAALKMYLPVLIMGRRTNKSVGAYFDLMTDDARMFYSDSFHFGYFKTGQENFAEALDNHTDLVVDMANIKSGQHVLDVGCGICAPAIRIAARHNCRITGVNISAEQVKQGRELVENHGLTDRITVMKGNALKPPFNASMFDSALCIEVAGDICVTSNQKFQLADELFRVLKPGGRVGFSDLVFTGRPTREEERVMRAILYHDGAELVTDWPHIFEQSGFSVTRRMDIIEQTMKTWHHSLMIYEKNAAEVERRYGKAIAKRTMGYLRHIPEILHKYGSFIVMSAEKKTHPIETP